MDNNHEEYLALKIAGDRLAELLNLSVESFAMPDSRFEKAIDRAITVWTKAKGGDRITLNKECPFCWRIMTLYAPTATYNSGKSCNGGEDCLRFQLEAVRMKLGDRAVNEAIKEYA